MPVAALLCLTIALICAIIARVLLVIAAINISGWWALGIFLPFGPTLFRLNYPEAARSSFMFRVATLICVFLFVLLGPAGHIHSTHKLSTSKPGGMVSGFASEFGHQISRLSTKFEKIDPQTIPARRAANDQEFARLKKWDEVLRARKAELLASDVEGNRAYDIDLAEYKTSLANANAEKRKLDSSTSHLK